jgi:hypothetical protein
MLLDDGVPCAKVPEAVTNCWAYYFEMARLEIQKRPSVWCSTDVSCRASTRFGMVRKPNRRLHLTVVRTASRYNDSALRDCEGWRPTLSPRRDSAGSQDHEQRATAFSAVGTGLANFDFIGPLLYLLLFALSNSA